MVTFASKSINKELHGNGKFIVMPDGNCRSIKIVSANLVLGAKSSSIIFSKNGANTRILPGTVVNYMVHPGENASLELLGMPKDAYARVMFLVTYDRGEDSFSVIGQDKIQLNDVKEPKDPGEFVPQQPHWLTPESKKVKKDEIITDKEESKTGEVEVEPKQEEASSEKEEDDTNEVNYSENVITKVMKEYSITDRDLLISTASEDDDNKYLTKVELESAAKNLSRVKDNTSDSAEKKKKTVSRKKSSKKK